LPYQAEVEQGGGLPKQEIENDLPF
jgi:hypothetical protein